ncbi:MAG: phosphomannose isomerase type II C-terminal cupin domain [Candidatus Moranbacteria bacterium]|nr:phosphomannose isomerase type II C-terminal cupin domain [Candidatus Moranbacteria bacterium]
MSNYDKQKDESMKPITKRPWGEFEILDRFFSDEPGSKTEIVIKRISVNPGSKLSLQSHAQRSEQWNVVSGKGEFIIGDKKISVKVGDCAYVPQGEKHHMINSDNVKSLVVVEVDRGLFDEDDIVRYEDDYGRV